MDIRMGVEAMREIEAQQRHARLPHVRLMRWLRSFRRRLSRFL